jgi:ATP-dependent Zn protease
VLFLIGFFLWMGRQAGQGQASIFNFGRTKARKYSQVQ